MADSTGEESCCLGIGAFLSFTTTFTSPVARAMPGAAVVHFIIPAGKARTKRSVSTTN